MRGWEVRGEGIENKSEQGIDSRAEEKMQCSVIEKRTYRQTYGLLARTEAALWTLLKHGSYGMFNFLRKKIFSVF